MQHYQVNGFDLAVHEIGEGRPVLLVHGFPFTHAMWASLTPILGSKYHVIAPDLRGFGNSPDTVRKVTMERYADDLYELLRVMRVEDKIVLCGLSMGGYIAMQFVRKYPGKLRGLVLCDTRTKADEPGVVKNRLRLADVIDENGLYDLADGMIPKLFSPRTIENRPEVVETVRQMIVEADPRGVAAASRGMAERKDTTKYLVRATCPSLVVCGSDDVPTPPDTMREIAEELPEATFVEIADAGHMSPIEQPGEFNMAICDFLSRLDHIL